MTTAGWVKTSVRIPESLLRDLEAQADRMLVGRDLIILEDTERPKWMAPSRDAHHWFLPVDVGRADPVALEIGRFHERHPHGEPGGEGTVTRPAMFVEQFCRLTEGAHLVGAVTSFDEERLRRLVWSQQAELPSIMERWHYHLVDVENLAAGYLANYAKALNYRAQGDPTMIHHAEGILACATPPWDSEQLSRAVGVGPERFDRHTAMGDAEWARAIYQKVMT